MRLRQARKILKRLRKVRFQTAMAAIDRLNLRVERWGRKRGRPVINRRPTMTAEMLLQLDALAVGAWKE